MVFAGGAVRSSRGGGVIFDAINVLLGTAFVVLSVEGILELGGRCAAQEDAARHREFHSQEHNARAATRPLGNVTRLSSPNNRRGCS